jgi:hypothetical protein
MAVVGLVVRRLAASARQAGSGREPPLASCAVGHT